jgi:hypothetical protein
MMDFPRLSNAIEGSINNLLAYGREVNTGHWQGYNTEGKPDLTTDEVVNLSWSAPIPATQADLLDECDPSMPWADLELKERVGRVPRNPHQSLQYWPWWHEQTESTMYDGMFSHTYSERFWPRDSVPKFRTMMGVRYHYGDLDDVISLLHLHPLTRQATFPIFFPEDTGAVHGGRIPCTLHYHFLNRENLLHLWYPIRSCDAVRHFRDDVYMAGRLCQWVLDELRFKDDVWEDVKPGNLYFTAYSFHVHRGDKHQLRSR